MSKKIRSASLHRAVRSAGGCRLLDWLEQRVLLTVTWCGGPIGDWSVRDNWIGGAVPAAGDDVLFNTFATVTVDTNYGPGAASLGSLMVRAKDVVLNFAPTATPFNIAGNISLDQVSGIRTSLELGVLNAGLNTNTVSIAANGVVATGNSAGWALLVVDPRTTLNVNSDINGGWHA